MSEDLRRGVRRHLCVAVDAKDYSRLDAAEQEDLQAALVLVLRRAAERAGLERLAWSRQEQGDGELALVPPDQDEKLVVDDFVRELDAALDRHNHGRRAQARLRLRLAFHHGIAYPADNGYAGPAPVVVSRLLASDDLHEALEQADDADLVVALSDGVYQDLILNRLTSLRPEAFRSCLIEGKKYRGPAWIRVLHRAGAGAQPAVPRPAEPEPAQRESAAARYQVTNNFHGDAQIGVAGFKIAQRGT